MDKETLCGKTFETASGYIVTCHRKKDMKVNASV